MKLIIKEGIYSKNSPKNTMDSIILSLNNNYIDGISITAQMTQDGIIIVYPTNNIMHKNINKIPYKEVLKYNIGTKIKKNRILTLKEVLEKIKGSSKKLIIELVDCNNNLQLVESIIELTSEYPDIDIYLKTNVKEELIYLREIANTCKVGATILDSSNNFFDLNLDFYSIDCSKVNPNLLLNQINNKIIMLENLNDKNLLEILNNNLSNYHNNIYSITDNQKEIVNYFNSQM